MEHVTTTNLPLLYLHTIFATFFRSIFSLKSFKIPNKISIIPFKRCPHLRSYLTELFRIIWKSGKNPHVWKRACTILIHKNGEPLGPSNFRPITFETVPLKIFTSCLRDSTYAFLQSNGYIEHKVQKGFLPKLSGTFEHIAQLANVIKQLELNKGPL